MNLTETATKLGRETAVSYRDARRGLKALVDAGCTLEQADALIRTGSDPDALAAILTQHGLERRKGAAGLVCGHEITIAWCTECAAHMAVKP